MNGPHISLTPWLAEKFIAAAPAAAAAALNTLATHEALQILKPLKADTLTRCLSHMQTAPAAAVLRRLPSRQAAHVLGKMELKAAAPIYGALSVPQREKMKTLLPAALVQALQDSAGWPAGSAGHCMRRDFIVFKTENKLADMIEKLKVLPRKKLPPACLIVAKDGTLKGMIRTAELAFYQANSLAGAVMSPAETLRPAQAPAEAAAWWKEGQPLVPVTDEKGVPLGVLGAAELAGADEPKAKKRFPWF